MRPFLALAIAAGMLGIGDASANSTELARGLSKAFGDVYEKVSPSVVVIEAEKSPVSINPSQQQMLQYFFQTPRGNTLPNPRQFQSPPNQGSGFILTADGYILTNNHVLDDANSEAITVTLHDGRKLPAVLIGADPPSDLAVLKIEAEDLHPAEIGDSDQTRVGEFAFALGSPYDLRYTFTFGIIGAKGRTDITGGPDYEEYIQTDAAINPGNSGGPLVDIDGRVIGVNTLINGINRGLGFAIPINIATRIASQMIAEGRFIRPWLGIGIVGVTEHDALTRVFPNLTREDIRRTFGQFEKGVVVTGFDPTAPDTTRRNLRVGDVILRVDENEVATSRDLQRVILDTQVGQSLTLAVSRAGRYIEVQIPTTERSDGIIRASLNSSDQAIPSMPPAPDLDAFADPHAAVPEPDAPSGAMHGLVVSELSADRARTMGLVEEAGVYVVEVEPGSPADAAQIRPGDVITSIGSRPVRTVENFQQALDRVGDNGVMLHINRGDRRTFAILKP